MGFLASLHEQRSYTTGPLTMRSPELARLWAGSPSSTGIPVNEETALNYSAVYCATSLISSDVASIPLNLFQRLGDGGKRRYTDNKLYRVLHDEFNPEMSSMVARETMQAHALSWGNAYAEIVRDGAGRVSQLWPLTPDRVSPYRENGRLRYRVSSYENGRDEEFDASEILHIPGLGFDGLCGYSVVTKARESIGLGLATERFGGTFFGNGSSFGGVFMHPARMSEPAQKNFRESLEARHQGVDRAHKFLIVEEGMKYERLGIPPNDAQFLETRKFQIEDIARWFRLPPHKIGAMEHATFSNIEQQDLEYYKSCLRSWLVRWEQEINRKLIPPLERTIQFVEHNIDGLLRSDIKTRYDAYAVARQWGWYSADDVLEKENMNPLPNGQGKIYLVPQNMWPADKIDAMVSAQTAKAAPAPAPAMDNAPAREALDLLEQRLTAADACVAEARAKIETHERIHHELQERAGVTAQELAAAKGELDTERVKVGHLEAMRAELATDRDRVKQELDTEQAARRDADVRAAEEKRRAEQAITEANAAVDEARTDAAEATANEEAARQEATRLAAVAADAEARAVELATAKDAEASARQWAEQAAIEARTQADDARQRADAAAQTAQDARTLSNQAEAARAAAIEALHAATAKVAELETAQQHWIEADTHRAAGWEQDRVRAGVAEQRAADLVASQQAEETKRKAAEAERDAKAAEAVSIREAESAGLAATIAAHRALVEDIMRRMVERETDRARRAQITPEKLRRWLETFYDGHEDLLRTALLPAVRIHLAFIRSVEDPIEATRRLANAHVTESMRQIRLVLDGDADEIAASFPALLHRWDVERPAVIAEQLMQKELDYARRR